MYPDYDLDKIKFGDDPATFQKAVDLYEKGKVTKFEEAIRAYGAVIIGTKPYHVSVEARNFNYGHCTCYLGEQDILCKHMVALAIYAILRGKPIPEKDKKQLISPVSSGNIGELSKEELARIKKSITDSLRYVKAYTGPSRTWFAYQASLSEGTSRLSAIISELLVSKQTADILVDLLLRLDKKVCSGGVDDSDGTVDTFIHETVVVLEEYAKLDPKVKESFKKLENKETCFGWEELLLKLISKN